MSPLPWAAILRHGPTIVATATRLFATANANKVQHQHETFEQRVSDLENASAESARLLQEIAQQVQALAEVQEHAARTLRLALILSATAVVLALAAGIFAVAW